MPMRKIKQLSDKHMKKCSTSHVIRELRIKTTRHHDTPVRLAKTPNADHVKCKAVSNAAQSPFLKPHPECFVS